MFIDNAACGIVSPLLIDVSICHRNQSNSGTCFKGVLSLTFCPALVSSRGRGREPHCSWPWPHGRTPTPCSRLPMEGRFRQHHCWDGSRGRGYSPARLQGWPFKSQPSDGAVTRSSRSYTRSKEILCKTTGSQRRQYSGQAWQGVCVNSS